MIRSETIIALATPLGHAPLAILRISGDQTFVITKQIFSAPHLLETSQGFEMVLGQLIDIRDPSKPLLDQVMLGLFKAPRSYTGEDLIEIYCHGGPVIYRNIQEVFVTLGAHLALPGEFTQRALLNNKMDLIQAESIHELIFSQSTRENQMILNSLNKQFSQKILALKQQLLFLLSKIEVKIDYPDEDIEDFGVKEMVEINQIVEKLDQWIKDSQQSKKLKQGYQVAIVGAPNVGKSSLLNLLVNEDKAIVSSIAGTTRDPIECFIEIEKIPFHFIDTAGIRDHTENEIEILGIEKSKQILNQCDLILEIKEPPFESHSVVKNHTGQSIIIVHNKIDLLKAENKEIKFQGDHIVYMSTVTKQGKDALIQAIMRNISTVTIENTQFYINQRQSEILLKIRDFLIRALACNMEDVELLSFFLFQALDLISELDGSSPSKELFETIFSNFCVGK